MKCFTAISVKHAMLLRSAPESPKKHARILYKLNLNTYLLSHIKQ